jgi:hypothetical protein
MNMKVEHRLPTACSGINYRAEPGRQETLLAGYMRHRFKTLAEKITLTLRPHRERTFQGSEVLLWNHQEMRRGLRMKITDADKPWRLIDTLGRDPSLHDFTKVAVCWTHQFLPRLR